MENSFQNYPERLGYFFHSNGFEKTMRFRHVCKKALEFFIGAKIRLKTIGRWSKQQIMDAK